MGYTVKAETKISVKSLDELKTANAIELSSTLDAGERMVCLSWAMSRPARGFRVFRTNDNDPKSESIVAEGDFLAESGEMNLPVASEDAGSGADYTFRMEAEMA